MRHVGIDKTRRNGIDADLLWRQLLGQRLGDADHRRLAATVDCLTGITNPADDRRQVDDAAATSTLHHPRRILAAIEGAVTVGREGALYLLLLDHAEQRIVQHPCIVDQHVQLAGLAKELLEGLLDRLRIGHIEAKRYTRHAKLDAERLCHLGDGLLIATIEPQLGALGGKLPGDGETDAAPSAGDHYPFTLQQAGHQRATPYLVRISRALATELMSMMSSVSSSTP